MANWWLNTKEVNYSRKGDNRFLNSFDMSEAKRVDAILNSRIKRGEVEIKFKRSLILCKCGMSGCLFVHESDS